MAFSLNNCNHDLPQTQKVVEILTKKPRYKNKICLRIYFDIPVSERAIPAKHVFLSAISPRCESLYDFSPTCTHVEKKAV